MIRDSNAVHLIAKSTHYRTDPIPRFIFIGIFEISNVTVTLNFALILLPGNSISLKNIHQIRAICFGETIFGAAGLYLVPLLKEKPHNLDPTILLRSTKLIMINWQEIDTVLLDMDGTLLDLHFDNYFWLEHLPKRYATIHSKDETSSRQLLAKHFESKRGTLNWYCLDYWAEQLQLDIPELKREIQHMIRIRPFVMEFLQQLRESPKRVMLVTNAHRASLDIKLNRTGIADLFDDIIVSHDYRAPKEQQQFWLQMRINHQFDPARTLLIDDTMSVLTSAQQFGIKHLLTLLQPDSQQAKRQETEFPGILHFDEIMPVTILKK